MAEQLDTLGGEQLKQKIERMGVTVHTGKNTTEITASGSGESRKVLHFADGSSLETDFVVFSTGSARVTGLPVSADWPWRSAAVW